MLALQVREAHSPDSESAYKSTSCAAKENCSPSSVKCQQPINRGILKEKSQLVKAPGTRDLKVLLLKEFPPPENSKSTGSKCQEASLEERPLTKFDIVLHEVSSAKLAFPEFFPRDKMFCYHTDLEPFDAKADPILCSWMLFFGHQQAK